MAERLRVTPLETSVILLNEIFGNPVGRRYPTTPFSGHYSEAIAKALHGTSWKKWYNPESNPIRLEDFLQDAQRSCLLVDSVNQVLETLSPTVLKLRQRSKDRARLMRLRFGSADGLLHTQVEIGHEFGVVRERIRQIEQEALGRLRHPSRSKHLIQFLPKPS